MSSVIRIAGLVLSVFLMQVTAGTSMANTANSGQAKHIVLVGASIGKDWQFDRLGERVGLQGYRLAYVGLNSFDKRPLIQDLLKGNQKPDMVMIKECATYFPGDFVTYQNQVISWVGMLRAAGIQPVLVTVAPITEPTDYVPRLKNFIKRIIGKPTWLDSILQYNDWLKQYAGREKIRLFDLEAPLRRNERERWLRVDYDVGDGMHLNRSAYDALDNAFKSFLLERN